MPCSPRSQPAHGTLRRTYVAAIALWAIFAAQGCGATVGSAVGLASVAAAGPGPLVITHGGTYSGHWSSENPAIPAVSVQTDEPVILQNAVLTSRGDLIDIPGTGDGANVTVRNVSGTALDPGVAGVQRGSFVSANNVARLTVDHCSMFGVSFGVEVLSSTVQALRITDNLGSELEDRTSDGQGGLESARPNLGHFIFLHEISAPAGAEVAWNQMINTIGSSSTEDVINVYKSQGSAAAPISVHDNYMEGYSSVSTASYTGAGLIADGDANAPVTAFVRFDANQMVHTAGSGVNIANGHDITATNNRIVSCGMDAEGNWFAMPFVNAVILWNYYEAPGFANNTVQGTKGGMVRPSDVNQPAIADLWARTPDLDTTDVYGNNDFTDPCISNGQLNRQAEDMERALWAAKLAGVGIKPGVQPTSGTGQ